MLYIERLMDPSRFVRQDPKVKYSSCSYSNCSSTEPVRTAVVHPRAKPRLPGPHFWRQVLLVGAAVAIMLFFVVTVCLSFYHIGIFETVVLITVNGMLMVWMELQLEDKADPVGASRSVHLIMWSLVLLWAALITTCFSLSVSRI